MLIISVLLLKNANKTTLSQVSKYNILIINIKKGSKGNIFLFLSELTTHRPLKILRPL